MKQLFILVMAAFLSAGVYAQATNAKPHDYKNIFERILVVELLEEEPAEIAFIDKRISKSKSDERKQEWEQVKTEYQTFIEDYNKNIKKAVEAYWNLNNTIEFKTRSEVKKLFEAKSTEHVVMYYSEKSFSDAPSNFGSGATFPTLNYTRTDKPRSLIDYSFFLPWQKDHKNTVNNYAAMAISMKLMLRHLDNISHHHKRHYTFQKYAKHMAHINCKDFSAKEVNIDESYRPPGLPEDSTKMNLHYKLNLLSTAEYESLLQAKDDKMVGVIFPTKMIAGARDFNFATYNSNLNTQQIYFMKLVVSSVTGDVFFCEGVKPGQNILGCFSKTQLHNIGTCDH